MIMGLGFTLAMWRDLRPLMSQRFRTIVFDNRGVGKSDILLRPFSISMMMRDAACVLDAAGVSSTHVIGFSMGGMIAQELALSFPDRVRKLVLGCTMCGGRHAVNPDLKVRATLARLMFMSRQRGMAALLPFLYDEHTPRARIEQDLEVLRRNATLRLGVVEQLLAILSWRSYDRLPQIKSPTLVIHGANDQLVPPENARILADRIPDAKLVILANASHIFPSDQPELAHRELLNFLTES